MLGGLSGLGGYLLSYFYDLSVNAGHALTALGVALAVWLMSALATRALAAAALR